MIIIYFWEFYNTTLFSSSESHIKTHTAGQLSVVLPHGPGLPPPPPPRCSNSLVIGGNLYRRLWFYMLPGLVYVSPLVMVRNRRASRCALSVIKRYNVCLFTFHGELLQVPLSPMPPLRCNFVKLDFKIINLKQN